MKKIGIILISALIVVLLVIVTFDSFFSKDTVNKANQALETMDKGANVVREEANKVVEKVKTPVQTASPTPKAVESIAPSTTPTQTPEPTVVPEVNGIKDIQDNAKDLDFIEVEQDTIPYTEKYMTLNAELVDKKTFCVGSQLIYMLIFKPTDEKKIADNLNYFVSYKSFISYDISDMFEITYEVVGKSVVSVVSVKKLD